MGASPVLPPQVVKGSLRADGSRDVVQPADVRGRFVRARRTVYGSLVTVAVLLPWITIGGHPALLLDVAARRFFVLGATFNAQDVWLMFFVLSGVGFSLIYVTAWYGRVFCGWACPQTVLLDLVYRRVERWCQGPREARLRRSAGPWDGDRVLRTALTHAAYLGASFALALGVDSFFVPARRLAAPFGQGPAWSGELWVWTISVTAVLYFNFGFFREQLCLAICPYGRLQSSLIDADTVTVAYDARRGEPRGKAAGGHRGHGAGDCVDCKRCVVVCPTGIDIRNGLQLDCVACTACVDACDEIMTRLDRPIGLIRYASASSLAGGKTRWIRPRTVVYSALLLAGACAAAIASRGRQGFEANLLRLPGPPYVLEGETIRDGFEVHVVNKHSSPESFSVEAECDVAEATVVVALPTIEVPALEGARVPVLVALPRSAYQHDADVRVRVRPLSGGESRLLRGRFLGARSGGG